MTWHRFALLPMGLVVAGCAADTALQAPAAAAPVARAQKPDEPAPARPPVASPADTRVAVRVVAIVNGAPILDDEVREAAYYRLLPTLSLPEPERSRVQHEILHEERQKIIDREVVLTEALAKLKKMKPHIIQKLQEAANKEFDKTIRNIKVAMAKQGTPINSDEELIAIFQSQGTSFEGMKRQIERSFMMMEYMRSRIFPEIERIGYDQVLEYYQGRPSEFQIDDRVFWQDLFVDTASFPDRQTARGVADHYLARAQKGEDFKALITEYNSRYNSFNHTDDYSHRPGEVRPPEAEPILFGLSDGQVGPVIEMASGFHVIRLTRRQQAGLKPLDEQTQAEIKKKLQNLVGEREFKRIMNELKSRSSIQVMNVD